MFAKVFKNGIVSIVMVLAVTLLCGFAPYTNDANTVLLDHFDGSTSASILAYSQTAGCGSPMPSATPISSYVTGPTGLGQALSLTPPAGQPAGSATYLQYPGGQLLSTPNGTVELWIYLTAYGVSLVEQGQYPGACMGWTFGMSVSSTGLLQAGAWAAFSMDSGAAAVPLNAWTHVAATWGSTGAKLYMNGVLVGSSANTGMPASGYSGSVLVGKGGFGLQFDELRISNIQQTSFPAGVPPTPAFSVAVKNFSYNDNSGRFINYNFSAGTDLGNAIQVPDALPDTTTVVTRGTNESGTTYYWGMASGLPPVNVALDTANQKATVSPQGTEGVAVLYAAITSQGGTLPAASGTTTWSYTLNLGNFNLDFTTPKAYEFNLGLGRDGSGYNEGNVSVLWVKGYYNGTLYATPTLIIQPRVENSGNKLWSPTIPPIIRTDLDPATANIAFDLSVSEGNNFHASANVNNEGMTNLGSYTLTTEQGTFQRLPDLYPYLYMGWKSTSTDPQANVQSMHFQGDGKYYASFFVQDPLHKASAVRVTGASYVGAGVDLNWNDVNTSWYSSQGYEIGSTPITDPWPSFTFTFTPQSGGAAIDPQTKTVTGYVTEFASGLQPSGSISSNPVFSWTAPGGSVSGYSIELSDGTNRIWNMNEIPASQTSVTYNGTTALVSGKTYNYMILSQVEQGSAWNTSFAQGSFTYYTGVPIAIPGTANVGTDLSLTYTSHPPYGFTFPTGAVAQAAGDFMITGYQGNAEPYSAYGFLTSPTIGIKDLGVTTLNALTEIPATGYTSPASISLLAGHGYAFRLAEGVYGILAVKSVTLNLPSVTMVFDYKYWGGIAFNGAVKTVPTWPSTDGMAALAGTTVSAYLPGTTPTLIRTVTADATTGAFTLPGIPKSTTFYLQIQPSVPGYTPVLSKFMNWTADIQALLPFGLFTMGEGLQYPTGLGITQGTGSILGRVALKSDSPPATTFLAGATITATDWDTSQPVGTVTYTSGSATQADGIYVVKDIPTTTKTVQLVATLAGHTFQFNGTAIVPVAAAVVSEESFFATPVPSPFKVYSYHQDTSYYINMFVDDVSHAYTGVTVNGPGLAGDVGLTYVTERGRWELPINIGINLGSILPTEPRMYNFTAATGGTPVTGSKTVSVYVEGVAANLQPTNNVTTAAPTFSWTGIPGATGYSVMLEDVTAANAGVWTSPQLTAGQTSVLYNGAALVSGHTYQYTVISWNNTDGNGNSSFARAQFTYAGSSSVDIFTNEAAFTAAMTPTKLVNFEDRDTSQGRISFAGNEYTAGSGITFSTPNAQPLWIYPAVTSWNYWNSKHLSPGNAPYEGGSNDEDSLTLTFNPAVTAIGWTFLDYGGTGNESIRVYGEDNSLIYENANLSVIAGSGVGQGNNPFWGISSPNKAIARVEIIEAANDGDDVAYDNFRFSPVGQSVVALPITGYVKNSAATPVGIDGVTVEQVGAVPANSTVSAGGGLYNLNVPSDIPFYLKFSMTGYVPTYTAQISATGPSTVTLGDFNLFPEGQLSTWTVTQGQGIIRARVRDEARNSIGGVTVTAFSRKYSSYSKYTICYDETCSGNLSSTDASSGLFFVRDVDPEDTITVTAVKDGWTFNSRIYQIAGNAIHQGAITGTPPAGTIAISGTVKNWTGGTITSGVTVALVGDPMNTTTASTTNGTFNLSGIPVSTPFSLKFSAAGYLDVYASNITVTADKNITADGYGGVSPINLPTTADLTSLGAQPASGKALIWGRIFDQNYLAMTVGGVTVTATSAGHPSPGYPVLYRDPFGALSSQSGTWGNGYFYILNVDAGDTVTVTAARTGWTFGTLTSNTIGDGVSIGRIFGQSPAYDASLGGFIRTSGGTAVSGESRYHLGRWFLYPGRFAERCQFLRQSDRGRLCAHLHEFHQAAESRIGDRDQPLDVVGAGRLRRDRHQRHAGL
jgi:hypothetical protein